MGYSESYFSRYFKNIFGVTFSQYMNAIKTSDAMLLLRGNPDLTITQVAGYCGFNSIRHFNRVFKNLTGSSPSDFASDGFDSSVPSIQLGKYFFPTLSSSSYNRFTVKGTAASRVFYRLVAQAVRMREQAA